MSIYCNLFVGPFAVWEAPKKSRPFSGTPLDERLVESGVLLLPTGMSDVPEVKRGRKTMLQYAFMPGVEREGMPARQMQFGGQGHVGVGFQDLTGLDTGDEIKRFAEAFGDELEELAGFFGEPPTLRWGMVEWLS